MSDSNLACRVFATADLLPGEWRTAAGGGPVRTFNPALLGAEDGWLLAYRVVLPDGRRRLAACRLDATLEVVAGTAVPLSDWVSFRAAVSYPEVVRQWLADPRLYRWEGRLFVYWNSGWHEPQNHQFLQELDPASLHPIGHARELKLRAPRRPLEKNWTMFAAPDGALRAVYSVCPHRVLRFSIVGDSDIVFDEAVSTNWVPTAYPASYGGLRGGAPPARMGDEYWSFCHTVHDGPQGYCYRTAAYSFAAAPPFAPVREPVRAFDLAPAQRQHRDHPRLNPAVDQVVYPCGAAFSDGHWLVSHGINDERCAISRLPHAEVLARLRPCARAETRLEQKMK